MTPRSNPARPAAGRRPAASDAVTHRPLVDPAPPARRGHLRRDLDAPRQPAGARADRPGHGRSPSRGSHRRPDHLVLSVTMFARQQRALLHAYGVAMGLSYALALAYARTAIAAALPAGSAVSAAYAFQRFRAHGASRTTAASVTILSGTVSALGLLLLYLAGTALALIIDPGLLVDAQGTLITGGALVLVAAAVLAAGRLRRRKPASPRWSRVSAVLAPVGATFAPSQPFLAVTRRPPLRVRRDRLDGRPGLPVHRYRRVRPECPPGTAGRPLPRHPTAAADPAHPRRHRHHRDQSITGLVATGAAPAPVAAAVLDHRLLTCWLTLPVGAAAWALSAARSLPPGRPRNPSRCRDPAAPTTRGEHR